MDENENKHNNDLLKNENNKEENKKEEDMNNKEEEDTYFKKIKESKWKQNTVSNIRFKPTLLSTTITFFSFGCVLILLGIIVTYFSITAFEIKINYSDCNTAICYKSFNITKDIKGPFIFAYELNGFHQNMRNYLVSRSDDQLKGNEVSAAVLKKKKLCEGARTNGEMNINKSFNNSDLDPDDIAIPCGIMAKTFFNDTYVLTGPNNTKIEIDEKNIAWSSDKKQFKNIANNWQGKQWLDMTDEHFIVWMRPSAFNYFRKLWGIITTDFKKGEYTMTINNVYDIHNFNGKKFFIISKFTSAGGKNLTLGICYLTVGIACVLIGIGIVFGYNWLKKREEDEQELF